MIMNSVVFFIASAFLITSFFCFDYLLKYQYLNHKQKWIEDGEPTFIWGRPKDFFDYSFSSYVAGISASLSLVFANPDWIKTNPKLRKIALIYRLGVVIFWIFWMFQVVTVFNK